VRKPEVPIPDEFYEEVHRLLLDVLTEEAPEEADLISTLGPGLIRQAVEGQDARGMRGVSFEFSPLVEDGLMAAKLVASLASLIQAYIAIRKIQDERKTRAELEQRLESSLLKEGLSPAFVHKVVKRSGKLIDSLLKKQVRKRE